MFKCVIFYVGVFLAFTPKFTMPLWGLLGTVNSKFLELELTSCKVLDLKILSHVPNHLVASPITIKLNLAHLVLKTNWDLSKFVEEISSLFFGIFMGNGINETKWEVFWYTGFSRIQTNHGNLKSKFLYSSQIWKRWTSKSSTFIIFHEV